MIDPLHRDGAARIVKWQRSEATYTTPLALAAETPDLPAPAGRLVLTRTPRVRDAVLAGGSRFTPTPAEAQAFLVLPDGSASPTGPSALPSSAQAIRPWLALDDDLPYPPASGADLVKAGHEETYQEHVGDRAFVAIDPAGRIPADAEVVALGHARAYLDNPYTFAKAITTIRENAGPQRLLYAPGCGLPQEIALLVYCGVDVIDDAPAILAARQGIYVTPEGNLPGKIAVETGLVADDTAAPLRGVSAPVGADAAALVAHARQAVVAEVARVHAAIRAGKLRELVEQRTRASPDLAAHLRRLDLECYQFFAERVPLLREGQLFATSKESLERPEIVRYRRRIARRYRKPTSARILLLLPCSASKPYSRSKTHRILGSALERVRNPAVVHEVVVTSPMGVVPRELELVYPAAHYDLPVTGHWDEDEKHMIQDALTALLARSRYDAIVVHLDEVEMEIAAPALGDFHYTVDKDPLSPESLDNLANTLNKLADALPRIHWRTRTIDDMSSLARFQFGEAGQALVEGADVKGKLPFLKLVDSETGEQLAMTTEGRGYLSLALEGGRRLMDAGHYRVEIEDFRPSGTIFGVGITHGDAEISPEDEVILHHAGEFRGVGRALVAGAEMGRMKRGACVSVRHKAESATAVAEKTRRNASETKK